MSVPRRVSITLALVLAGCGTERAPESLTDQPDASEAPTSQLSQPESIGEMLVDSAVPLPAEPEEPGPPQTEPGDADFPRGSVAFAELVKAARESDAAGWSRAEAQLQELGAQATAALKERLADADPVARELAAMFLAQIGPDASSAAPGLVQLLSDDSAFARVNAAAALSTFEGFSDQAAPVLADLLMDPDENVRLTAATALRNVGPAATAAIPRLAQTLGDASPQIRAAAATTLGELGATATASLPALKRLTIDSDESVATAATEALKRIADASGDRSALTIPASATK